MENIYGDNVSWFCLEGSVTLEESKVAGDFLLDDEFEVYGEDSSGNEGSVNVDVIKLLESAHVCIADKDKKIDRMVEEIAELKSHLENLVTESIALAQFKNDTLRGNIRSTDLDEPEWHDYQTIGEAGAYLEKLNQEGEG